MGRAGSVDSYVIVAGVRTERFAAIERAVAEHMDGENRTPLGSGHTPPPYQSHEALSYASTARTVRCGEVRDVDSTLRLRGRPTAVILFAGGSGALAAHLAAYTAANGVPLLLYVDTPSEPLADLQAVIHANPQAVFMHASIDLAPRRVCAFLQRPVARCATGRVIAGIPLRGDRVTQSMLTQIAVGSRRGLSTAELARAHRMTTSAVRARFAGAGLIAPRDVSTTLRALHALWYLLEASERAEVVAHRMNLGSRENVLERVRAGTGLCYRAWKSRGGFDVALANGMSRLVTVFDG